MNGVWCGVDVPPGYGDSSRQRGRSVVDVAPDTAEVLDALEVHTCLVGGGSSGGPHALACPHVSTRPKPSWWSTATPDVDRAVLADEFGEDVIADLQEALRTGIDGWVDDTLAFVNHGDSTQKR